MRLHAIHLQAIHLLSVYKLLVCSFIEEETPGISFLQLPRNGLTLSHPPGPVESRNHLGVWGEELGDETHTHVPMPAQRLPFRAALVVSIDKQQWVLSREHLSEQRVPAEVFWGFDGRNPEQLSGALELLSRYNHTRTLHKTVGNVFACMHMSPGTSPNIKGALKELFTKMKHRSPHSVEDLLELDMQQCVPKMVAIAASHVRIWEGLAQGWLPSQVSQSAGTEDPWYLIMEDDSALCPGWLARMLAELPLLPADADIVKLFFFGHWRKKDQLPSGHDGTVSPFLEARDPMRMLDILRASSYEVMTGSRFKDVPVAGYYAGTQAYLVKRSGARKLLESIQGKPFQDIDMTMMSSVKHYVWRKPLAMSGLSASSAAATLLQVVPKCNTEPPRDWWFHG